VANGEKMMLQFFSSAVSTSFWHYAQGPQYFGIHEGPVEEDLESHWSMQPFPGGLITIDKEGPEGALPRKSIFSAFSGKSQISRERENLNLSARSPVQRADGHVDERKKKSRMFNLTRYFRA